MVKWEYMCNICKTVLPNAREVMLHCFFQHPQVIHYATPIDTDVLPIPKKAKPAAEAEPVTVTVKRKAKVKRTVIEEPEEELAEGEDLSLD